jgi:hypothetical protein
MTLSLRFSVQPPHGQRPVFSPHRRGWRQTVCLPPRAVTLRSWRRVHRQFRWPHCQSRAVVLEPVRRFRMCLACDSSVPLWFLPWVDQSPRSHPVPQFDVPFCNFGAYEPESTDRNAGVTRLHSMKISVAILHCQLGRAQAVIILPGLFSWDLMTAIPSAKFDFQIVSSVGQIRDFAYIAVVNAGA